MLGRADLALGRDASSRFLPGLLAVMVYLAALAMVGALAARGFVDTWDARLAGTLTVQVPPSLDGASGERIEAVLRLLRVTPGIRQAVALSTETSSSLLEPWLGPDLLDSLAVPRLIDVRLDPAQVVNLAALRERLENAAPGTRLDDHGRWLAEARSVASAVTLVASWVLGLVLAAAILAVVFAVRTGLAVHRDEIEILHLIGAPNGYIARQFQWYTARLAVLGGLLGAGLAVLSLVVLNAVLEGRADGGTGIGLDGLVSLLRLGWREGLAVMLIPMVTALIAMMTARWSVLIALARLS